jgi:hypothetical protein
VDRGLCGLRAQASHIDSLTHSLWSPEQTGEHPNHKAYRRTDMTATTTHHDCADHGCLAAMLGVEVLDATAGNADEGSSPSW